SLVDGIEKVSSDESLAMAKRVIKEEGIPVGISGGAAMVAALRQAALPENKGKMIVVILPSYTERYLSTLLAQAEREKAAALPTTPVDEAWLAKVNQVPTT
ncbi:MAG: pyridoxal-phosphate dependent enzyme, partial [Proteobacteria bacterium]